MGFVGKRANGAALTVAIMLSGSVVAAPYEIIDLGTLGGNTNFAMSLNDINEVVGNSNAVEIPSDEITADSTASVCATGSTLSFREFCNHAYLFRNNSLTDLGQFNQDGSFALSINNQSTTVGYAIELVEDGDPDTVDPARQRAFISYDGGAIEAIPFPPETDGLPEGLQGQMTAQHISDDNLVIGFAFINVVDPTDDTISVNVRKPYIYDIANDSFQYVPAFVAEDLDFNGTLRSMNSLGQVVGWGAIELENGANTTNALFWDPAAPELSKALGTLGGFSSQAYDLNDTGFVVGVADTDQNFFRNEQLAFVYDNSTDTMTELPEFSRVDEFTQSVAYAINNANQIVGSAQASATVGTNAAFIFNVGATSLTNLNDMVDCSSGWNLVLARDINESGHIIGTGTFEGEVRSFLLVPTADTTPTNCSGLDSGEGGSSGSTGFLFLTSLALYGLRRRRK